MRRHSRALKRKEKPLEVVTVAANEPTNDETVQQQHHQQLQQQQFLECSRMPPLEVIHRKSGMRTVGPNTDATPNIFGENVPDREPRLCDDFYSGPTQACQSPGGNTQMDDNNNDESCTQSVQTQAISSEPDSTQPVKNLHGDSGSSEEIEGRKMAINGSNDGCDLGSAQKIVGFDNGAKDGNGTNKRVDCGTLIWEKDKPE